MKPTPRSLKISCGLMVALLQTGCLADLQSVLAPPPPAETPAAATAAPKQVETKVAAVAPVPEFKETAQQVCAALDGNLVAAKARYEGNRLTLRATVDTVKENRKVAGTYDEDEIRERALARTQAERPNAKGLDGIAAYTTRLEQERRSAIDRSRNNYAVVLRAGKDLIVAPTLHAETTDRSPENTQAVSKLVRNQTVQVSGIVKSLHGSKNRCNIFLTDATFAP